MRIPDDVADAILDTWPVARLATSGRDGRPHQVPVVFARAGGLLWSPVDGKPKRGGELTRVRHVLAQPAVSLLLDHYEADWSRLWWLRVDGAARVLRTADPEIDAGAAAAVAALRRKYPQYEDVPVLRDPPTLLAIQPRSSSGWAASPEAVAPLGPGARS